MVDSFSFSNRLLWILGAALILVFANGCSGSDDDTCEVAADCGDESEWDCIDGACMAIEDLCEGVTCGVGEECDPQTGECVAVAVDCCNPDPCVSQPGTQCDPDLCETQPENPCVPKPSACAPACGEGFICNESTGKCVAECVEARCDGYPKNYRCNLETGACENRKIAEGEVGYPCGPDSDVCADGTTCFDLIADDPGALAWCSIRCTEDRNCPAGSYCESNWGQCVPLCGEYGIHDCADGTQCSDLSDYGFPHFICLTNFDVSKCQGADCLPDHAVCDPDAEENECEAGLTCLRWNEDGDAACTRIMCGYSDGGCPAGDRCFSVGNNLTACFAGCDPTVLGSCGDTVFDACFQGNNIPSIQNRLFQADSAEECARMGYQAEQNISDAEYQYQYDYTCYLPCGEGGACPPGQFCIGDPDQGSSACVGYHMAEGQCDPNPCGDGVACAELPSDDVDGDEDYVICFKECLTNEDCDEAPLGRCTRLTDDSSLCTYPTVGGYCFFGCDDDYYCGYCESDDDCGTRNEVNLLCDLASNTCRMPSNAAQRNDRCQSFEVLDGQAILTADGANISGCAISCEDDRDCVQGGSCDTDRGFCVPQFELCNHLTGQCEPPCADDAECLHVACGSDGACRVGCESEGDCDFWVCDHHYGYCVECLNDEDCDDWFCDTELGLCVEEKPGPECVADEDCTQEGYLCNDVDGVCVEAECLNDDHCAAGVCNDESKCVECLDDDHCTEDGQQHCHPTHNVCVECLDNDHCTEDGQQHCHQTHNVCVECTDDAHCDGALCDTAEGVCSTADCTRDDHCLEEGLLCDVAEGLCVGDQCLADKHCLEEGWLCDLVDRECVEAECLNDDHCVGGVCNDESECVECTDNDHCAAGVCSAANECVECLNNDHCDDGVCSAANECVECLNNDDCAPGVCNDESECVECLIDDNCGDTQQMCEDSVCVENPLWCDSLPCQEHANCQCDSSVCIPALIENVAPQYTGEICALPGCVVGDSTTCPDPDGQECIDSSTYADMVDGATSLCVTKR